jgi:hypothetical protein
VIGGIRRSFGRLFGDFTLWPALLLGVAVLVDLALAKGVVLSPDSRVYLAAAQDLVEGRGLADDQLPYAGYILLVAASKELGTGVDGVIALQYVCVLVTIAAVWGAAARCAGRRAALLAALLVVSCPDLGRGVGWPGYLLTDVPYMCAVAGMLALSLRSAHGKRADLAWLLVASCAAVLLRPNGWLLVATCWSWVAFVRRPPPLGLLGAVIPWIVCLAIPISTGLASGGTFAHPADEMQSGTVVWDSPMWRRAMPQEPDLGHGYGAALHYAIEHPADVADLAARRVAAEALHIRTSSSTVHNVLAGGYATLLLVGAALALVRLRRRPEMWLAALLVGLHLLVVAVHWADYDGRFFVHVVPALSFLAAVGWTSVRLGWPRSGASAAG